MIIQLQILVQMEVKCVRGRCGHDRMVVGFTTTYAISATTDVVISNLDHIICE
jgi:hypothetical protein